MPNNNLNDFDPDAFLEEIDTLQSQKKIAMPTTQGGGDFDPDAFLQEVDNRQQSAQNQPLKINPEKVLEYQMDKKVPFYKAPRASRVGTNKPPFITRGMTYKGLQLVDPEGSEELIEGSTGARKREEILVDKEEQQQFVDKILDIGKDPATLNLSDLIENTGDIELSKKLVDLKNALAGGKDNQEKFAESSVGIIEEMIKQSLKIPAASGFYGKNIQGKVNSVKQKFGGLPEKEVFELLRSLSGPMIAKGLGDTGAVSDTQQIAVEKAIAGLAHPQKETREAFAASLENIMSSALRKPVKFNRTPFKKTAPTSYNELDTETLFSLYQKDKLPMDQLSDQTLQRLSQYEPPAEAPPAQKEDSAKNALTSYNELDTETLVSLIKENKINLEDLDDATLQKLNQYERW